MIAAPDPIRIRAFVPPDQRSCEDILRGLPQWFGIEQAIVEYVASVATFETLVAARADAGDAAASDVIGFLTLHTHNRYAAEIHVMAVRAGHHGSGIGRRLVEHAEDLLNERDVEYLHVKTLGPSRPNDAYARTRGFYHAMGFRPIEENRLWGDVNPCLMLVKYLPRVGR